MQRRGCLLAVLLLASASSSGHEGHAHRDAAPLSAPASATVPLAASAPVAAAAVGEALNRRPARVIADVRKSVLVAAPEAGVLEAPPGGFKRAGQKVVAGELLGRLRPATPQLQRRDIEAKLVEARRDADIGALQIDRYGITEAQRFDVSLPTQTLQILTDYTAAKTRREQLQTSLDGTVEIRAPRSGRVLRADADASRQFEPGEAVFAIQSDGDALVIELKDTDEGFVAPLSAHAVLSDGRELPLTRIGSGFDASQRAHVALYAPVGPADGLIINQRLRLQWPQTEAVSR
ncbi:MAG: hypothetical protein NTZ11_08225 [Gammaproteobacteria bacterium]|nr:hypothetical protein [Gammaproteobacteria bacterium]